MEKGFKNKTNIIIGILINITFIFISINCMNKFFMLALEDSFFITGVLGIILSIFINFSGNPMGLSISSLGCINSQYVSRIDLESQKHENESKVNINLRKILNSLLFTISIMLIVVSYIL